MNEISWKIRNTFQMPHPSTSDGQP